MFDRRSLRTCHYQRQRLWPLRSGKHPSRYPYSRGITSDHHIVVVVVVVVVAQKTRPSRS